MPISTIRTIKADGSFNTDNGRLYAFFYSLEDGMQGVANHKTERPPFREGEEVSYELNGETKRGDTKLKITRPDGGYAGQRSAQPTTLRDGTPATTVPGVPVPSSGTYFGATVGMAVNNGCEIAMKSCEAGAFDPGSTAFWEAVYNHASRILRLSALLESGRLASKPSTTPAPPEPARSAFRPQPGPDGSVAPGEDSEHVPF